MRLSRPSEIHFRSIFVAFYTDCPAQGLPDRGANILFNAQTDVFNADQSVFAHGLLDLKSILALQWEALVVLVHH